MVRRLNSHRVALGLYSVLLVLPTLALGGLHGYQLWRDHTEELRRAPLTAEDGARRLRASIEATLDGLLESEARRSFAEYAPAYLPESIQTNSLALRESPLRTERTPEGVLGWFQFDRFERDPEASVLVEVPQPQPRSLLLAGFASAELERYGARLLSEDAELRARAESELEDEFGAPLVDALRQWELDRRDRIERTARLEVLRQELEAHATQYIEDQSEATFLQVVTRVGRELEELSVPAAVAAVANGQGEYLDAIGNCFAAYVGRRVTIEQSNFHLQYYRDADGVPRLVATRRVILWPDEVDDAFRELRGEPCVEPIEDGFAYVQGIFLDPQWFFETLPARAAERTLGESFGFVLSADEAPASPKGRASAQFGLLEDLRLHFEVPEEANLTDGRIEVYVDTGELTERFRDQSLRFLAVAAMLLLTLGTGMVLLLRTVSRDLEQAARTENFAAAVTHELRTPLSAIKLLGEMLLEGWTTDEERKREYYRRIVRETGRLGTLVERVLEQSRLSSTQQEPRPGDLDAEVRQLMPHLAEAAGGEGQDLAFELAEDLPQVMLVPEAVDGILDNLVENARKYAPVQVGAEGPAGEPILIRTRLSEGRVLLEVLDRGPGIPADEAERIFEAFYRMGNEATRSSQGTGLGLHLVHLHAQSVGARISVHSREGGGAIFRIAFRRA